MIRHGKCVAALRLALALMVFAVWGVRPALAQSVLRDTETEAFFEDIARPLAEAAGLDPGSVRVELVADKSINAFATSGQAVYLNSGLVLAADNVNEIQGVIAHELGHVAGGHVLRMDEGVKGPMSITILSLLLGAAAMAAGAGEAGAAVMGMGQTAAMGKFLAYTRTQEAAADQAGATFLEKAGVSGKGSISFFKKLQNMEFRYGYAQQADTFSTDHPLTGDRIAVLENVYKKSPAWDRPMDPKLQARFLRVKAKLAGYVEEPSRTLQLYPETDTSVPARYARAYADHKNAYPDRAEAEIDSLLKDAPNDPYFLELKGQILLESGRVEQAIPPLRKSVALAPGAPLIAGMLGQALIASEKPENTAEAKAVLKAAVARDNENPFAWYQLGIAYARDGDESRAALATAEQYNLSGEPKLALANAQLAMSGLQRGTPDWIRAQDIAMVSRTALKDKHGRSRE